MKKISIVTPTYNEAGNVREIYRQVKEIFSKLPEYKYEHLFIDNASKDQTVEILKEIAANDNNIKIIVNTRNFGHIRSGYYGFLKTTGDAVITLVADLQDPPTMIIDFIRKWKEGYKIVVGVKKKSQESRLMFVVRNLFYRLIGTLSEVEQVRGFTGFGLYDKRVVEILKQIDDPYPYFRGLITDLGFEIAKVEYFQPKRWHGRTKNNFYTLYDLAMLGITNHSKIPLRLATMLGFLISILSILTAFGYLIYKLVFWNNFNVGIAPLVIGFFFFASVQLFFIGILGEYIGSIHTQVLKRPLVIEKERINF
ncbi:MAG: glycosyltransferase family 2 protein [bacterium]